MTLYKRPLSPFDPVVKEGQDGGSPRYYRDDFSGSGQDSFTAPPSQDASMWQALLNVMPISRKSMDRRWGYGLFSDLTSILPVGSVPSKIYEYQRDTDGLRKLIITTTSASSGLGNSFAIGEDGTVYATNITFSQAGENVTDAPRALVSRSTMYFYGADEKGISIPGSNLKWDGSGGTSAGVTNWGIDVNNVSGNTSGPNYATAAADVANVFFNRPTVYAATLGDSAFTNPALAIDGNPATSATATATSPSTVFGETYTNFLPIAAGTSATTLHIKVTAGVTLTAATGSTKGEYSTNNGSTWNTLFNLSATTAPATYATNIFGTPDTTQLQFRMNATLVTGTSVAVTLTDVWTESTVGWSNVTRAEGAPDAQYATTTFNAPGSSDQMQLSTYALSASGSVVGIQAGITANVVATGTNATIFRPTTYSTIDDGYTNPQYAIDGLPTTRSQGTASNTFNPEENEAWTGFGAYGGPTPSTVTLLITSSALIASGVTSGGATLQYSLDGGITRTTVYATGLFTRSLSTDTIALSIGQDLTKVIVYASVFFNSGTGKAQFVDQGIVDIWIEVVVNQTLAPGASLSIQLLKDGAPVGAPKSVALSSGVDTLFTIGGATDLWGATWLSTDVTASNFGLQIQSTNTLTGATTIISVDSASIVIYLSGAGVAVTSTSGAGSLTLVIGRIYYLAFSNSVTGHISDVSFPSVTTGPLTNRQVVLTIPTSLDPQVDTTLLLATADGGDPSTLYLLASLAGTATTYTDQINDTVLTLNQIYLQTDQFGNSFGIGDNTPPPLGNLAIKHQGRLWMALGQNLFFSKSTTEVTLPNGFEAGRYEEAWPGANFFDIAPGAETVTGLLSDGSTLYIGTQRHVRRLYGSDPTTFQEPEVLLQGVGVLNQDVWIPIFMEGTPSGAMWLTPDNKVIMSDFNTYRDVGTPIQDVLNTINPNAVDNCHAMYASSGPYDVFILAIPTGNNVHCDTHLVYDIRTQVWAGMWMPSDPSTAMHFNINGDGEPQWLFTTPLYVYQYSSMFTQDRVGQTPVNYISVAQTSWLDMGFPTYRKLMNEIEVTGDPTLTVTLEGANTQGDFTNTNILLQASAIQQSVERTYKLYLASIFGAYKRYRFSFSSTGPQQNFLDGYNIYPIPLTAT